MWLHNEDYSVVVADSLHEYSLTLDKMPKNFEKLAQKVQLVVSDGKWKGITLKKKKNSSLSSSSSSSDDKKQDKVEKKSNEKK